MKNICNEEKSLKRYLKNHVSLNVETMVKFLITGMIGVSLTACGGGGGGGSSSPTPEPPVTPPVIEEVEVNKNNESHEVTNSNSVITGTITGTQDGFTALKAVNSSVENKAEISVEGNNTVAIHGTTDVALLSLREKHTVTNNGTIKVKGDNSTGILIENGVVGINNKKITVTGNESSGMAANGSGSEVINKGDILVEGNGDYLTDSEGNIIKDKGGSTGIRVNNGATGVNNGSIETKGSMNIGMHAKDATIINNGNIETNSAVRYMDDSYMDGDEFIEKRGMWFSYEKAMEGRENSYIENNGTIVGTGSILGMVARIGSAAVNKGDIEITGKVEKYEGSEEVLGDENGRLNKNMVSFSVGIRGREKSEVSNEGNISIIGGDGIGVDVKTESSGKNTGNIYLEGSEFVAKDTWTDEEDGEKYEEDYTIYTWTAGMRSRDNSIVINEEKGNITIKGRGAALQATKNSEAINKGNIDLESIQYIGTYTWTNEDGEKESETEIEHTWVSGMQAIEGSKVINDNSIYLKGSGSGVNIHDDSEGINNGTIFGESIAYIDSWTDSEGSIIEEERETWINGMEARNNSRIENNGIIQIAGSGVGMEMFNESEGINNNLITLEGKNVTGARVQESGKFINSENGVIEVKATEYRAQGITSNDWWEEEKAGDIIIENHGKIRVEKDNLDSELDYYAGASVIGIRAEATTRYDENGNLIEVGNLEVSNTGLVHVVGNNGLGIEVRNGTLTNTGEILLEGKNTTALKLSGSGKLINTSKLEVTGVGIKVENWNFNEKNIVVENEGDIVAIGNGEVIKNSNNGNNYYSIDAAKGIESSGGDIYNSGNIVATGNGAYLEYEADYGTTSTSGKAAQGIYASNAVVVKNEGDITVTGDGKDIWNGAVGIYASGKSNYDSSTGTSVYEKVNVENSGEINLDGDYATGISVNMGELINIGKIEVTGISSVGISSSNNYNSTVISKLENEGDITVTGDGGTKKNPYNNYYSSTDAAKGINSSSGDVYNSGNIAATGNGAYLEYEADYGTTSISSKAAQGIYAANAGVVRNEGDITVAGNGIDLNNGATGIYASGKYVGYDSETGTSIYEKASVENSGSIKVDGDYARGISLSAGDLINTGKVDVTGISSVGISSTNGSSVISKIENEGDITVAGDGGTKKNPYNNYYSSTDAATGINSSSGDVYNSGNIVAKGTGAYLEYETDYGTSWTASKAAQGIYASNAGVVKNEGDITVTGDGKDIWNGANGIYASGKYNYDSLTGTSTYEKVSVENSGMINVVGTYATGIKVENGDLINTGKIEVEGNNSNGIRVSENNSTAINLGIINIDGAGSYGMYAQSGATVTNGATGVINVGASAAGGMYADWGSKAINDGTINIHKDNAGGESIALVGSGELVNNGTVTSDTDLTINSINGGAYVIGTSEDGSYGKISAKNVSIDGDVVVSAGITKNGFKNEYTMQNVVDAEDIALGDSFNFTSNSLLYDAEAVTDRWGNLDATLSRNDKTLSDFTTGYVTSTAKIFGKYQNEDSFKTLSSDAKEVIKAIDTSSVESINETLNGLTPKIYANLGRQILETSETFKEQDMVAINSLGENSYNFTFIGEYQDVDSRDNIEGYKSKMTGFVGAMNFGYGTFGTIGYGYNDIDYKDNGKGHIQTIHLGLNRFGKYEGVDYNFGLGGEYNFHENKRDIDLLGRKAESDFDSYGVRASGEISKVFGKEAYVKPYLGLDLAHMKYDSFTESKANSLNANIESENYTSVLPKVGFLVGDRFGGLNIYAGVEYSYELGNMDKEQNFSYEGFEEKGKLPKDNLESGTTGVKAGASYEVNNFTLGASIGKNFGRRDNSFASLSLGYSF